MKYIIVLLVYFIFILNNINHVLCKSMVPVLTLDQLADMSENKTPKYQKAMPEKYVPFMSLIDKDKDTSEYWRETEILSLVRNNEIGIDYERCERDALFNSVVKINSPRTVRPICRNRIELIPQRRSLHDPCFCDKFRPEMFKVKKRTYIHNHKCPCWTRRRFEISKTYKAFKKRKKLNLRTLFPTTASDDFDNYQLCPQCPHFNNHTECELFRDSCRERRVNPSDYRNYCDRKYGKWRAMFVPADYSQCRCCDECIFYRELDQSCMEDEYSLVTEEFLPTTSIDFRAGCNQYWGHPEQEFRALRCDKILRRCVPVSVPQLPKGSITVSRRNFRYETVTNEDCPVSCLGYECKGGLVPEKECALGGFLPDKNHCNCCGKCSVYHQLNEKCAEFKKTFQRVNGTVEMEVPKQNPIIILFNKCKETAPTIFMKFSMEVVSGAINGSSLVSFPVIQVEEEFLEPGCDDGLVCREGRCQDIHSVPAAVGNRRKRDERENQANEPCKRELKYFKKKFGPDGHLHYNAPQCSPLWLYAPVQCRRFVCYCALEDGSFILGIKVPRVEVSNMNCDCARERCRTGSDVECDGYGNYKEAVFTPNLEDWGAGGGKSQDGQLTTSTIRPEIPVTSERDDSEYVLRSKNLEMQ